MFSISQWDTYKQWIITLSATSFTHEEIEAQTVDLSQVTWLLSGRTGAGSHMVVSFPSSFHYSTEPAPPLPSPPLHAWQQIHSYQMPSSATKARQLQSQEMRRIQRPLMALLDSRWTRLCVGAGREVSAVRQIPVGADLSPGIWVHIKPPFCFLIFLKF